MSYDPKEYVLKISSQVAQEIHALRYESAEQVIGEYVWSEQEVSDWKQMFEIRDWLNSKKEK